MDKRQISTKLTLDGLGLTINTGEFQNRLIFQKAIYIAQVAGINLGYFYSWYLYGPYCSSLASDGFAITAEIMSGQDDSKGWQLDETSVGKLEKISSLFSEEDDEKLAKKLELLASVHFLIDRKQVPTSDASKIMETLKRFNKNFTEQEVENSLKELRNI